MKNALHLEQLKLCSLEDIKQWYLKSLEVLVNEEEYQEALNNFESFLSNDGHHLYHKLTKYKDDIFCDSWLMPYSKDLYLNGRGPVSIESNYLLETIPYERKVRYLNFVTGLIEGIQDLFLDLHYKRIPQMKAKKQNLCMKQLKGFLRGSRSFNLEHDDYFIYGDFKEAHSCLVFYLNNAYYLKLFEEDGTKISGNYLYTQLLAIYQHATINNEPNFNILAFNNSDDSFKIIAEDPHLKAEYQNIKKTMFTLSLSNLNSNEESTNLKCLNIDDAYPIKSWNIKIYQDLVCTFNNEHTFVDGLTSLNMITYLFKIIDTNELIYEKDDVIEPEAIKLFLNKERFFSIKKHYLHKSSQFDSIRFEYHHVKVEKLLSNNINVDAIFQLGFLYANYFTYEKLLNIHESVSAAKYYDGRTSTLKTISKEGLAFIKALAHSNNENHIFELLLQANQRHLEGIFEAKEFNSIERVLGGLSIVNNKAVSFYQDQYYQRFASQDICTSSMSNTKIVNRFAYPPVVEKGLGIGYLSHNDIFICDISYYVSESDDAFKYFQYLHNYFDKLNELLTKI